MISGFVYCNCYEEGRTSQPPYADFVIAGKRGIRLDLQALKDRKPDPETPLFKKEAWFDHWKKTACEHDGMLLAQQVIGNETGLESFKSYLYKNGGEKEYQHLLASLPDAAQPRGAVFVSPEALTELQLLKKRAVLTVTDKTVLQEKTGRQLIMIGDYDEPVFFAVLADGYVFMIKEGDFYILDGRDTARQHLPVLFRASSFYTHTFDEKRVGFLKDEESEMILACRGLGDPQPAGTRMHYVVSREHFKAYAYYRTPIDALEKLFEASLQTGKPVWWEQY